MKGLSSLGQKPTLSSQVGLDSPVSAPCHSVCLGLTLRGLGCLASQADAELLEGWATLRSLRPSPSGRRCLFSWMWVRLLLRSPPSFSSRTSRRWAQSPFSPCLWLGLLVPVPSWAGLGTKKGEANGRGDGAGVLALGSWIQVLCLVGKRACGYVSTSVCVYVCAA